MSLWADLLKGGYTVGKELGLWQKLATSLRRKRKILVLGASGAGKTQFVNAVKNPLSIRLTTSQRTVSVERRKVTVEGFPFVLLDTPGQVLDEAKRKVAITDAIRRGVEGIINVTCYGYHEAAEAGSADAVAGTGGHIAKASYLTARRQVEMNLLSEWVPFMDEKMARWVITLVTKADLWWPEKERVQHYYEQGNYAGAMDPPVLRPLRGAPLLGDRAVLWYPDQRPVRGFRACSIAPRTSWSHSSVSRALNARQVARGDRAGKDTAPRQRRAGSGR